MERSLSGSDKMETPVYGKDGSVIKKITLPAYFDEEVRPDIIKRAVLSEESKMRQPKGNYIWAGFETSAKYVGRKEIYGTVKNRGIPHLPHEVLPKGRLGKVKRVPHAVKGHRAHPPKVEKKIVERINKKEYAKALRSALSASAVPSIVSDRTGYAPQHVPIILSSDVETLSKTSDVKKVLESLKIINHIRRWAKTGSKKALMVVSKKSAYMPARNIDGMDVVTVDQLQVRHLAPGTHPGRLLLITESALNGLEEKFNNILKGTR